jgi:hypothetical protein
MKMNKLIIFFLFALSGVFIACDRDPDNETGDVVTPQLDVVVRNEAGNFISGATVQLFHSLNDYVAEINVKATKTSDASGKVTFTLEELGEPGAKYFNVISGEMRNWASVSATPVMTLTSGVTQMNTVVATILPEFLALAGNRFKTSTYMYPAGDCPGDDPCNAMELYPCYGDDELLFLKTGRMFAFDAGVVCAPHNKGYTTGGVDYSAWTITNGGETISIRDLDPWWNTTNPVANRPLTISGDGNTVTIDFGGGYVAILTKI